MTEREAELQAVRLQKVEVHGGPIELAEYNPAWPELYEREAEKIRAALGDRARALEQAGYVLSIREPDWHQHRLLKGTDPTVNLHVFSHGSPEVERMLAFRNRLRANEAERMLYERAKRELARRTWTYTQDYADAKTQVVKAILARAVA